MPSYRSEENYGEAFVGNYMTSPYIYQVVVCFKLVVCSSGYEQKKPVHGQMAHDRLGEENLRKDRLLSGFNLSPTGQHLVFGLDRHFVFLNPKDRILNTNDFAVDFEVSLIFSIFGGEPDRFHDFLAIG